MTTDEGRTHFELAEGQMLAVNVTDEGVIFDAFDGDEHVGTHAMTAQEWFDRIAGPDSSVVRINFTTEDVAQMAYESGVNEDLALERAQEWGKHILSTASELVYEQLASAIERGQP